MQSKDKNKKKKIGKASALSMLFCIPFILFLGGIAAISWICFVSIKGLDKEALIFFTVGVLSSSTLCFVLSSSKIRVIIHELKHTIPIILTGGKLRKFKANKSDGEVEFSLEEEDIPRVPYIALAPYYWPLFSLPVFIACVFFDTEYRQYLSIALGASLAVDVITGICEVHPLQTDFKAIYGGFPLSSLFIATSYFFWINVSLLWVFAGLQGYEFAGFLLADIINSIAQNIHFGANFPF